MEKLENKSNSFFLLYSPSVYLMACWGQISSEAWEHRVLEEYRIWTISTTKCELLNVLSANPAKD